MAENDAKKKEKTRDHKKEAKKISLPNARRRLLQSRELAQSKRSYEDIWNFVGTALAFFAVLFVLLGGINQRKTIETIKRWGVNIGNFVEKLVNPQMFNVSENGIYLDPSQSEVDLPEKEDFTYDDEGQQPEEKEQDKQDEEKH